jgi:hypothetical protein
MFSCWSFAQQAPAADARPARHDSYRPNTLLTDLSFGIADPYRNNYSLPSGFSKNSTTGFAPVYAKLEYGFWKHISVAATFGYDDLRYNFSQLYTGFNDTIKRYKTDNLRIFSAGVTAFYHLGRFINVKRLDPFAGVGLSLNNIRYNAFPQGDSLVVKTDHTVTPYLKAGVRYYISDRIGLYGDVGYDKQSIFSLGVTCRFYPEKKVVSTEAPGKPGS